MGEFATPAEIKARVPATEIQQMEAEDLDDVYIVPTERRIEQEFKLNLDTNGVPWHWRGRFEDRADLEANYRADYKLAVILTVRRAAQNPHGLRTQSIAGASAAYGRDMPPEVSSLMEKWGKGGRIQGRVFR